MAVNLLVPFLGRANAATCAMWPPLRYGHFVRYGHPCDMATTFLVDFLWHAMRPLLQYGRLYDAAAPRNPATVRVGQHGDGHGRDGVLRRRAALAALRARLPLRPSAGFFFCNISEHADGEPLRTRVDSRVA